MGGGVPLAPVKSKNENVQNIRFWSDDTLPQLRGGIFLFSDEKSKINPRIKAWNRSQREVIFIVITAKTITEV